MPRSVRRSSATMNSTFVRSAATAGDGRVNARSAREASGYMAASWEQHFRGEWRAGTGGRRRPLLRLMFASGRVDAFGFGSILGDDLPALPRLAHRAEIAG